MKGMIAALIVIAMLAVSFFGTAGLVWVVCWAFSWHWSWKVSIGIWALLLIISGTFRSGGKQ